MSAKTKILICGILPPPYFGHSMMYKMLLATDFPNVFDVIFFNMHFWTYEQHKKVTMRKLFKMIRYLFGFITTILARRPKYLLYNISFDRIPLPKDFLFCFLGKILGCRIVLHDMGQYVKVLYEESGWLKRWMVRWICRNAAAAIVLGEVTKKEYKGLMNEERIFSVPGSVEDTQKGEVLPRWKEESTIKVLYFSFLSVSKGIWTALKAILPAIQKNPRIDFTFAGPAESPQLQKDIEDFCHNQKLNGQVRMMGYVGDEEARTKVFREHDIFIFPTHRDVFGLVLLHAMAEGLPVVASREGAIPEIIRDRENGFLFAKGDVQALAEHIVALANDQPLRHKIGMANRERYESFYTPQKYGERMIRAFEEIERGGEKVQRGY